MILLRTTPRASSPSTPFSSTRKGSFSDTSSPSRICCPTSSSAFFPLSVMLPRVAPTPISPRISPCNSKRQNSTHSPIFTWTIITVDFAVVGESSEIFPSRYIDANELFYIHYGVMTSYSDDEKNCYEMMFLENRVDAKGVMSAPSVREI